MSTSIKEMSTSIKINGSSSSPETGCHSSSFHSSASDGGQEKCQQSMSTNRSMSTGSSSTTKGLSTSTTVPRDRLVVCPFCDPLIPRNEIRHHLTRHLSCSIVCSACESSLVQNRLPCSLHLNIDTVVDQSQIPALKAWMKEYINGCDRLLDQSIRNGSCQSTKNGSGQSIKNGSGQSIRGSNECVKNLRIKFLRICNFCAKLKDCGYIFGDAKEGDAKERDAKERDAKGGDAKGGGAKEGDAKKGDAKGGDTEKGNGKKGDANEDDYNYISRENLENHVRMHLCYFYSPSQSSDTWASRIITNNDPTNKIDKLDELVKIMVGDFSQKLTPDQDLAPFDSDANDDLASDSPLIVDDDKSDANDNSSAISVEKMDDDSVALIPQDGDSNSKDGDACLKDGACVKTDPYVPPPEHIEAMERLKSLVLKLERIDGAKKYNVIRDANLVLSPEERDRNKAKLLHDPYRDVQVIRREIEMLVPEHYPSEEDANLAPDASSKSDANFVSDANSSSEANSKSDADTSTSNATYFCLFCKQSARSGKKKVLNTLTPTTSGVQEVDESILTAKTAVEHYYKHLEYYPYQCSICYEVTPTEFRMKQHLKRMHSKLRSVRIIHESLPGTELWVEKFLSVQRMGSINKSVRGSLTVRPSCPVCWITVEEERLRSAPREKTAGILSHICAHLNYYSLNCIRCPISFPYTCATANYTLSQHVMNHHPQAVDQPLDTTFKRSLAIKALDSFIRDHLQSHNIKFNIHIFIPKSTNRRHEERIRSMKQRHEERIRSSNQFHEERVKGRDRDEEGTVVNEHLSQSGMAEDAHVMTDLESEHASRKKSPYDQHLNTMSNDQFHSRLVSGGAPSSRPTPSDGSQTTLLPGPVIPGKNGSRNLAPNSSASQSLPSTLQSLLSSAQRSTAYQVSIDGKSIDAKMLASDPTLANQQHLSSNSASNLNLGQNLNLASRNNSLLVAPPGSNQVVSASNSVLGRVKTFKPPSNERQIMTLDLDPSNFNFDTPELAKDALPNFNYFCIFCPKVDQSPDLESKEEAIAHYGKHLGYRPVICLLCSRKFTDLTNLHIHHRLMHEVVVNESLSRTQTIQRQQQMLYILNEDATLERWIDSFLRLQKSSHIFNLIELAHLGSCLVCERLTQTCAIRDQACPIGNKKGSSQKMAPNDKGSSSNCCDKKPKNAGNEVSLDHIYSHLGYAPYECILCSYEGIVTKFSVVDDKTHKYQNKRQNSNQLIGNPNVTKSGAGTPSGEKETRVPSNDIPIETNAKEKAERIPTHAPDNIKAINHLKTVHGLTDSDLDMEIVPNMFVKRFSIDKLEEAVHAHLIMSKFSKLIKPRDENAARQEAQNVLWDSDYEEDYEPAPPGDGRKRKAWIPEVALKSSSVCCLHCHAHVSTIKKLKRHHYSIHPQLSIATYSPGNVKKVRLT